jgi:chromatin remodeling complex protein RSC6
MPAAKSSAKKTDAKTMPTKTTTPAPTPAVTTTTAAPKTAKKTTTKKQETPVVETTPTPAPVVETTPDMQNTVVTAEAGISDEFAEFITKFQTMLSQFSALKTELKALERKTAKQLKVVEKLTNKKKRKGQRAPSGFVKPSPISNELADFLGKPQGSEMARTDVTREINQYIRANSLQDKENGRKINPDTKLKDLLKIPDDINLTYFNLQRYMGPHFPKQTKTEATSGA